MGESEEMALNGKHPQKFSKVRDDAAVMWLYLSNSAFNPSGVGKWTSFGCEGKDRYGSFR